MTAIVFASGLAGRPRFRVAGLALLQRSLIVARRAGASRCLVAGCPNGIAGDRRLPRVTPVTDAADAKAVLRSEGASSDTRILCLSAEVVTTPASLRSFIDGAPAAVVVALHEVPVALVSQGSLDRVWPAFAAVDGADPERLPDSAEVVYIHVPHASFAWVRRERQAAGVERGLLSTLENPRDGWVDTVFNRRVSRPLTRLLLKLPLTPNQITLLSFATGLLSAYAFAQGRTGAALVGAALFQLSAVLDCCDGEVARVKFQESALGDALDIGLDAVANFAVFLGIALGAWRAGDLPDAVTVASTIGVGIALTFPIVTYVERALPTPAQSRDHRLAQRLVAALSSRDFSLLIWAAALTGTLAWFLRAAALGANVFWIMLLVLVLRGRAAAEP